MVIKVCQGSPKALRNHLQAHHKKEFADMVKEEEEKKFKVPFGVKNSKKSFQMLPDEPSSVDQFPAKLV